MRIHYDLNDLLIYLVISKLYFKIYDNDLFISIQLILKQIFLNLII